MRYIVLFLLFITSTTVLAVNSSVVERLLKEYQISTKTEFNEQLGKIIWTKEFITSETGESRSCTNCHTSNPGVMGKHIKTKKTIEPLAPSVNSKRLTKIKTVKKWFKRNCKWTLGRECTAEEKGHLLLFIQSQ